VEPRQKTATHSTLNWSQRCGHGLLVVVMAERTRFITMTRQITGRPSDHHAYVFDRERARIVQACSHFHTRLRGKSGQHYAQLCAERMLRRQLRHESEVKS